MAKKKVLDHGFVELVDRMGSDLTVVNSARVSFGKRKEELSAEDVKLIKYLADHEHWSPFRHVQLQFHCKVPEFVARQWYKHVVGAEYSVGGATNKDHAWNEISGRYVDMSTADFYIPRDFRSQSKDNKQASTPDPVSELLDTSTGDILAPRDLLIERSLQMLNSYNDMVNAGVAKEQARMMLPLNVYTEFYWTVSLQGLVNFIKLRDHEHAQYEIQLYAKALGQLIPNELSVSKGALLT